ncbi:MAG: hypothetical protein ABEI98_02515 [Halorhabdus sp.]
MSAWTVTVWQTMFAFAVLTTLGWMLTERRIPIWMTTGMAAWGLLAFRSGEVVTGAGQSATTRTFPQLQWFAAFMFLVTALGLVLWWFGDFPPSDNGADDPTGQEEIR